MGMHFCMSWKNISFDWNRARAFLVTAEEGSLSAAARALGMTQPTLGRQVTALEQELGVTLFERVPQGLVLTESGLELIDLVRNMGHAASELSLRASGQSQRVEGVVCVSASEFDAIHYLPEVIAELRHTEPGIRVEVVVSNEVSDLKRREADIALRNFRPTQPDLIVRKLREENVWLYGTSTYLSRFALVTPASDITGLSLVGYERSESNLSLLRQKGIPITVDDIVTSSHSYLLQWHLVKAHLGVGMFTESKGDAEADLVRAFEHLGPLAKVPLWLVCHRELHTSLRVRRVFDLLVKRVSLP